MPPPPSLTVGLILTLTNRVKQRRAEPKEHREHGKGSKPLLPTTCVAEIYELPSSTRITPNYKPTEPCPPLPKPPQTTLPSAKPGIVLNTPPKPKPENRSLRRKAPLALKLNHKAANTFPAPPLLLMRRKPNPAPPALMSAHTSAKPLSYPLVQLRARGDGVRDSTVRTVI